MRRVIGRSPRLVTAPGVRETGIIVAMLAVGLLVRLPNLNAPLLAISSFRQTESAYPALIYHQQGINLLFPQLPVLGKPWQVPFEFPLFQAMAAVLMNLGGAADWAMRVSSVICFVATAVAVWGLVRHLSTRTAAGIAVLVFLASPFNVWWSRASMIEYMATAFSVGYVWAGMIWIDNRQRRFAVLAIVLGSLVALLALLRGGTALALREPFLRRSEPLVLGFPHHKHGPVNCIQCHHNFADRSGADSCISCHRSSRAAIRVGAEARFHDFCLGCHRDPPAYLTGHGPVTGCDTCHAPLSSAALRGLRGRPGVGGFVVEDRLRLCALEAPVLACDLFQWPLMARSATVNPY